MHWEDLEGSGGEEVGGGIGMGDTCKPMAVSFQFMTKSTTNLKKKKKNIGFAESQTDLDWNEATKKNRIHFV